jgi:DNA-directed RNA polymerase subunit RPC12/RpoP
MAGEDIDAKVETLRKRAEELRPKYPEMAFKNFLEESPPDTYVYVTDLKLASDGRSIDTPDIVLFCENEACAGPRIFRCGSCLYKHDTWDQTYLTYACRNCASRVVRFAIAYLVEKFPSESPGKAAILKVGQIPTFGPRTPARLIALIGPDREIFLQGRRCESRGLGIGAFAYYRRVVENQKNRIIAEIAKVAKVLGSAPEIDALFAAAAAETRFSESVAMVRDFIPQALMVGGRNPLTLLHSALSKGLHNPEMTDSHCLQLAQSIRTILAELAERASEALKSTKEIEAAISVLMSVPNGPRESPETTPAAAGESEGSKEPPG